MTSAEIAAMFKVGTNWLRTNTAIPIEAVRVRTWKIARRNIHELVVQDDSYKTWLTLPPAHAVIEARDGFLSYFCDFENPNPDSIVTLERVT